MSKPPSTKVMEIFTEAASVAGSERADILNQSCGCDSELRAEVESLLATQDRASDFLSAPTVEENRMGGAPCGGEEAMAFVEQDRVIVGRYTILERLGEGGFGVVYRARQNHPIRREVALKIVKLGMDTRQVIARFNSERQALARMDHPNIARIFDAGATADGRPYFAMELVLGPVLTEYCDAQRLTIRQRLDLFIAVCQAVQHAHQKGIIHRDIKPSNILLAASEGTAIPKIIDFGIAKAIEPRPDDQTAVTELRHFVGTPQYMSPEQAGAGNRDIDTRSDIYSLGVLLYELLSGATPFDPELLRKGSHESAMRIIREDDPPAPSIRLRALGAALTEVAERRSSDATRLCKTVSGELDWIVGKAMEKDRGRRYQTVAALAEDVRRHLCNETVLAGPPDTLYRLRKFTRRHRRPLLAASAVALAVVLGLAGTTFGLIRAKRDRDRAEVALAEGTKINAFLLEMLSSADPDRGKGNQLLVRDVLDDAGRNIDSGAMKGQPLVEAGVRVALGGSYHSLGLFAESEKQYARALEIYRRVVGPKNRRTLQTMAGLAASLASRGDYSRAEALAREALATFERTYGEADPDVLFTLNHLGLILRGKPDIVEAERVLRRAFELSQKYPPNVRTKVTVLTNFGVVLMDRHDWNGAEPLIREALVLDRADRGEKVRNVARNMGNLAVIRKARGDLKGAEAQFRDSLRLQREIIHGDHPDIAWTLRLLGDVEQDLGKLKDGEQHIREGLEMERRVFGSGNPIVAAFLDSLASVLEDEDRKSEAAAARREAMEIRLARETAALAANPKDAGRRAAMGDLHLRRSEFRPAADDYAAAASGDPTNQWYWFRAALLQCYVGDNVAYRETCRQMLERFSNPDKPEIADRIAKACLLSPAAGVEMGRINALADRAVAGGGPYVAWFQLCKGLAEYRAGNFPAARQWLLKASSLDDRWGTPTVRVLLAMTDYRLGGASAAAGQFREVVEQVERDLPQAGADDLGGSAENFLVFQILRREADVMMHAPAAQTRPTEPQ